MTTTYKWLELYSAAVLETDWSKIEDRIQHAEVTMRQRLHEVTLDHGDTAEENRVLSECLHRLGVLRNDVASWRQLNP